MSEPVFALQAVEKRFRAVTALNGVTMSAGAGTVIGLVGRNGAGKSTLLRCLVGLLRPTAGAVRLFGRDPMRLDAAGKQRLGYLSERGVPFSWTSIAELAAVCAPLYPRWDQQLQAELLRRFDIHPGRPLSELSLGQRRAAGLLLALCPQPELLVLDEPAANLDAVLRREFLQQVLELVAQGDRTVVFSSHVLGDVERIADRIALIHEGQLLLDRESDDLKERVRRLRLVFSEEAPEALHVPGLLRSRRQGRELLLTVDGCDEALADRLRQRTGAVVEALPIGLEELFIDLVGESGEAARA